MKIALLCVNPSLYANDRIESHAREHGHDLTVINPYALGLGDFLGKNEAYDYVFTRVTGVLKDDFDLLLIEHLEKRAKVMANPLKTHKLVRNKLFQYVNFQQSGLSVTPFYSFRGEPNDKIMQQLEESIGSYVKDETYILKPERGNQGKGVNIIRGKDSLKSWLETFLVLQDQKWIIQPFMQDAREIRFFFIKGQEPLILEKFITKTNFKGNFHQGAESEALMRKNTPTQALELATSAFELSGAYYASVDLLYRDGKAYILELNNSPGFREIEAKFSLNLASRLF